MAEVHLSPEALNVTQIRGVSVKEHFPAEMPVSSGGTGRRYYTKYVGVQLEDGARLLACVEPGCGWSTELGKSPGRHGTTHIPSASEALKQMTVGELLQAHTECARLREENRELRDKLREAEKMAKEADNVLRVLGRASDMARNYGNS